MIWIVVLHAISGFTVTLTKMLVAYASPFFLIGVRMLISSMCLFGYAYTQGIYIRSLTRRDWILIAQFAVLGVIVPATGRAWSLQYLPTVKIALVFNFTPFFSALFAYALMKEQLTLLQFFGLVIGFTGLIPLMVTRHPEGVKVLLTDFCFADLVLLIGVISFSYSLFIMQKLVRQQRCPSILANGMSMFLAGIFACNAAVVTESVWLKGSLVIFIQLLILNILLSNVLSAHLQAWILKHYSSTTMTFMSFLSPLFAALYSWIIFGESLSMNTLIAGALVVSGLCVYFFDHLKIGIQEKQAKRVTP